MYRTLRFKSEKKGEDFVEIRAITYKVDDDEFNDNLNDKEILEEKVKKARQIS